MRIGDRVKWVSQSQGFCTEKKGTIIAVVPSNKNPHEFIPVGFSCSSSSGFGGSRDHESYLILVVGKGRRLYWPKVRDLIYEE